MTILTATRWPSNAEMIEDVARLGYLDGKILDCSFGYGTFWANWTPDDFVACDLDPEKSPCGYSVDFRDMPFTDKSFDVVVFDPPYKLNGTPTPLMTALRLQEMLMGTVAWYDTIDGGRVWLQRVEDAS